MTKPADLTSKTWNKLKGVTVPKTGFGQKLDAYQAAKKKTEVLATRNLAAYGDAADALQAVGKHIPEAEKKCNKTLHKDTLKTLEEYKTVLKDEGEKLHNEFAKYQGYVDKYKHIREVCGKELAVIEKQMDAVAKSLVAAVKKSVSESKLPEAAKEAKAGVDELQKIQKLADDSLAKPRVPGPAIETPHADDRPDASVFTALIDKQKEIIAIRTLAEREVMQVIQDAMPKGGTKN